MHGRRRLKETGNRARRVSWNGEQDDFDRGDQPGVAAQGYGHLNTPAASRAGADAYDKLTGRERWIVMQLVKHKGAPNKVIAYALDISPNTLRNHLASIYAKLGVRRRLDLVLYAMERGLDNLNDG
jgi:DNA-binding NarL/FixJ family response regulator